MAKNDVKKLWFEDFQLGKTKLKSRRWVVKEPASHKGSFFGKAVMGGLFVKNAFKKANSAPKGWDQKSIAKVSYMKNSYQGQWGVHGRYLARQGAQLEDMPGLGFDATDDDLNISKTLRGWQEDGDPRLWKIIISPEMAHKLDLKEHVKSVMGHAEKDLGVKLEWVAIDHYNTDNFHAHVVIRGVDKDGKELRINKEYFTQGFRQRSIQEATRVLGLRLEHDILLKRQENIKAMHLTEMDREIERRLTKDHFINLKPNSKIEFMYEKELQIKGRLMFLEEMGLAKRDSSVSWRVDPGFSDYLKFIQTQQDIVKTKNKHIKNILNPNLPVEINKLDKVGDKLIGRVVGMGLSDSRNEPRYLLIEGIDNKIHYVLATEGMTKKRDGGDLRNGEIIYLERMEFIKEVENQEPKRVRYIHAESFQSFGDFEQAQKNLIQEQRQSQRLSLKLGGSGI
jgi:type IV secretory pathway VirD2 relaxase